MHRGSTVAVSESLLFEVRDVVHIILDYTNSDHWIFYGKSWI
jgi:phenylpyruvate tautomerase PptA (4-oxalocrotonate tautomerase family)